MFKMASKSPKGRLGRYEKNPANNNNKKIKSHKHPQVSDNTEKNWEREREKNFMQFLQFFLLYMKECT